MKFLDEARVEVAAGDGGDGCIAFLREKFRPQGGPAGGDGGRGGSVIVEADPGLNTLLGFRNRKLHKAGRGENGGGKCKHGKAGQDLVLRAPTGTIIRDAASGEELADLTTDGQRVVLANGGRGGRGNARFATSTHQAPRRADPGTPGECRDLIFELRLLADAGLIGLPNAGKSSLLSRLSAARPRVADYPFTTLEPVLGVVQVADDASFVLADIPGLVAGAHRGRGLGLAFLRHVARTAVLVHLVDASARTPHQVLEDFDVINAELLGHSRELAAKPQIAVASKADLPEVSAQADTLRSLFAERNIELFVISSASGDGCRELVGEISRRIGEARASAAPDEQP